MLKRAPGVILLLLAACCLGGCSSVGYYGQAVAGEVSLLVHRRSIDKVIADPATSPALRHKLEVAKAVRRYAGDLGLTVGMSYSTYEDIGRSSVVWNVFASPQFSLTPRLFCYPIAGCVSYRGYFSKAAAQRFASQLREQGLDVYVGGVAAYSTLGWFNDPILSTFVNRSDADLAALLFHELAHKTLYVKGDTRFNESYANTVEQVALKRWLVSLGKPKAYAAYEAERDREQQVIDLIEATNTQLKALYASDVTPDEMRRAKQADIERLRERYYELRATWGGHDDFATWMKTDINNAKLGSIATYNDWVSGFKTLLAHQGGNLRKFLASVKVLANEPRAQRDTKLAALSRRPLHADVQASIVTTGRTGTPPKQSPRR